MSCTIHRHKLFARGVVQPCDKIDSSSTKFLLLNRPKNFGLWENHLSSDWRISVREFLAVLLAPALWDSSSYATYVSSLLFV